MIAGDHPDTAISVARDLGIAGADETVITGAKLDDIDDEGLAHRVERARVYAALQRSTSFASLRPGARTNTLWR
jgi:Ca2+-transporting ATPase